jgi:DNA-binding Xre family transcriptional regulator
LANFVTSDGGVKRFDMSEISHTAKHNARLFSAMCVGTCRTPASHPWRMAKKQKFRWFAREWRKHNNLNLEAAADRLGMSVGYLSDLEKGKRRFNQDHLEAMAEAYNCTPADLLMRDPTAPNSIWSIWDQIAPTERETAVRVLQGFVKKASNG